MAHDRRATGPIGFDEFQATRLYDPGPRLLRRGRRRRPPAATSSPAPRSVRCSARCVARALDALVGRAGRPDPFAVVEAGAGPRHAGPHVLRRRARGARVPLRYVLVERRATAPVGHRTPTGVDQPDATCPATGSSSARRPACVVWPTSCSTTCRSRWSSGPADGWAEVRRSRLDGPATGSWSRSSAAGRGAAAWCRARPAHAAGRRPDARPGRRGRLAPARTRLARPAAGSWSSTTPAPPPSWPPARWTEWLRTYAGHGRAADPLERPGPQRHHLSRSPSTSSPSVAEPTLDGPRPTSSAPTASTSWSTRAARSGRSRGRRRPRGHRRPEPGREAEALTDPTGLGAFPVLEWIA